MVGIFGIVNLTRDSFSDGGRFLDPAAAIAQALQLHAFGADVLDVGAESTHPDAEDVPAAEEIRRLRPVVEALVARGIPVSVDTCKPEVMRAMVVTGVRWLNDVAGFRSAPAMEVVAMAASTPGIRFCAMFARNAEPRASRSSVGTLGLLDEIRAFCRERIAAFAAVGVDRDRLVLDPGMGFFLGRDAAPSLHVLAGLGELQREFGPLLVSVSRKSFVGEVTGAPVAERGPGTLAAELWAARQGVTWLRTHDVKALRAALAVEQAIAGATSGLPGEKRPATG